jgi:hypothetical protein
MNDARRFEESIYRFLERHGIETRRRERGEGVDVAARPENVGDRNRQATRIAGVLRRYGASYGTILDYLRFVHGYAPALPTPGEPLPVEELERIAKSIAEKPPKFTDMLRGDWEP